MCQIFVFIVHNQFPHFFKISVKSFSVWTYRSESMTYNLVMPLDFFTPCKCSRGQAHYFYFDLSSTFALAQSEVVTPILVFWDVMLCRWVTEQ
jgi:hypothetical protein